MIKNKSSDRKQLNEFKEVLGKESPKTLKDFQELKYNDINRYKFLELDYTRRNRLIVNQGLKLPNYNDSRIAEEKFTKYLFDGENEKGRIKGQLITKRLGYDINNYREFELEIKKRSAYNPAKYLSIDQYGDRYEQRIIMYGVSNNPTNVVVGWKVKDESTHLTSVYIKEVKKGED